MLNFIFGMCVAFFITAALFINYAGSKATRQEEKMNEVIDENARRKQEMQEQQIDDFSRMMSYDVEIAYDRRREV
jgi:hypothetical protein